MTRRKIIVIGGGAAGLTAAMRAAEMSADVTLLEKTDKPAQKLKITGGGHCNVSNTATGNQFFDRFGKNGRFLRSAIGVFSSADLLEFLHRNNVPTITESDGRILPESGESQDVIDALLGKCAEFGVSLEVNTKVSEIVIEKNSVTGVKARTGSKDEFLSADAVILCAGGASYPGTGSDGDGFRLAEKTGHNIVCVRPALIPLITVEKIVHGLQGSSLDDVLFSVWIDGRKKAERRGELLFTHYGLSGPVVLSLSLFAVDALAEQKDVQVSLDLVPDMEITGLDRKLVDVLNSHGKRKLATLLREFGLHTKLAEVCAELAGVNGDKPANQVNSEERKIIRNRIKDLRLKVTASRPITEAIVTAGGVDTTQINSKTMQSKLVDGLFFAGEVMDIQATPEGLTCKRRFQWAILLDRLRLW